MKGGFAPPFWRKAYVPRIDQKGGVRQGKSPSSSSPFCKGACLPSGRDKEGF